MNEFDTDFSLDGLAIAPHLMFSAPPSPLDEDDSPLTSQNTSTEDEPARQLLPVDKAALLRYVFSDHAYSKPFPSYRSKHDQLAQPEKVLQILPIQAKINETNNTQSDGEEIDIESIEKQPIPAVRYDHDKAIYSMNEVETYLNSLWKDADKDDEDKFTRGTWSREQGKFFDAAYKIINNYQLAKLTYCQNVNEPVLRKLALDKATKRMRKHYGGSFWNAKLIGWLHGVMIDCMGSSGFLCYLEIVQSLKRLVPSLVERMLLNDRTANEKEQTAGLPNLGGKLKKSWDPSVGLQTNIMLDKLPNSPFLITIPSGPSIPQQSTKRTRFWTNQFSHFGKPFPINVPAYRTPDGYVIKHYLEHCISTTRSKIKECSSRFSGRSIVLVGWGTGSIVSFKIALLEKVDAIICLGFPINGLGKFDKEYWEGLMKVECPVLFIIGTSATTNSKERIEELRSKMKVQTNMIILESGDELLRLSKSHKRSLGLTQNMVDRLIQDEIFIFLKEILYKQRTARAHVSPPKKKKRKLESQLNEDSKRKKKCPTPRLSSPPNITETTEKLLAVSNILPITSSPKAIQSTSSVVSTTKSDDGIVTSSSEKTAAATPLEKDAAAKKTKVQKKSVAKKVANSNLQKNSRFTANLGNQKAGNLLGNRFSISTTIGDLIPQLASPTFASGSFVLTGNPSQVRIKTGPSAFQPPAKLPADTISVSNISGTTPTVVPSNASTVSKSTQPVDETLIAEGNDAAMYLSSLTNQDIEISEESKAAINPNSTVNPASPRLNSPPIDLSNLAFLSTLTDVSQLAKVFASQSGSPVEKKRSSPPSAFKKLPTQKQGDQKISVVTSLDGSKKITYNPSKNKHIYGMPSPVSQKVKVPRLKAGKSSSTLIQIPKTQPTSRLKSPFTRGIDPAFNRSIFVNSPRNDTKSGSIPKPATSKVITTVRFGSPSQPNSNVTRQKSFNSPFAFSYPSALLSAKMKELSAKKLQQQKHEFVTNTALQTTASINKDLQKAAEDVKLVSVLNACRDAASVKVIGQGNVQTLATDELITPRTFAAKNKTPTCTNSSLADHLFTSMKIPLELERNTSDETIDFSIGSSSKETSVSSPVATNLVKQGFLYDAVTDKNKLTGVDIQLVQKLIEASSAGKVFTTKGQSESSSIQPARRLIRTVPFSEKHVTTHDKSQNVNFPKVLMKDVIFSGNQAKTLPKSDSNSLAKPASNQINTSHQSVTVTEKINDVSTQSGAVTTAASLPVETESLPCSSLSNTITSLKKGETPRKVYPERSSKSSSVTIQKIVAEKKTDSKDVIVIDRPKSTPDKNKDVILSPKESPQSYVTRSGRVMKARFFVPEDHSKNNQNIASTKKVSTSNQNMLVDLIDAAQKITSENNKSSKQSDGNEPTKIEEVIEHDEITENPGIVKDNSSKDIAATAMLDLLNVGEDSREKE